MAGSIGTVIVHFDHGGELEQKGVKPTIIQSAPHKMDGHPFGPLDDESAAYLRGMVDQFNGLFLNAVAMGRGDRLTRDQAAALEGRCFIGEEAVARGLIDQIGSFDDAITLARSLADARDRAQSNGGRMTKPTGVPDAKNSGSAPSGDQPSLDQVRAEVFAAGREEGVAAGAEAERTRILGIEGVALAGHDKLVAEMKADGKMTPEQAALRLIEAEKASPKANEIANLRAVEEAASAVETVAAPHGTPKASTPDGWRAEYEVSDKLQAEYPTAEAYIATMKREARK